jgi:RNA polymerase sigma-70 factor (ECF subfamily)
VEAVGALYAQYREAITRYLSRLVGNAHDADDLTAETFVKVIQAIDQFHPRGLPFSAWIYRIAHNVAMDHFRAADRASRLSTMLQPRALATSPSAEDEALALVAHRATLITLQELPAGQRDVLGLVVVHGLSNRQAAQVLGRSEVGVKATRYRALRALQADAAKLSAAGSTDRHAA